MENSELKTEDGSLLARLFCSTIGRKYLMGVSGLALCGFLVTHLLGNLNLLLGPAAFNTYAYKLHSLGVLLEVAELGLLGVFVVHVVFALFLTYQNRVARPQPYVKLKSKGAPSKSSVASRNMIWTGAILLGFLVVHILQMKYGASIEAGYVTRIEGRPSLDLYRHVFEVFQSPFFVFFYTGVMIFLGMHLRHGFWSAFQSLALACPRSSKLVYAIAAMIAVLLAVGFLLIPLWMHFFVNSGANL